MGFNRASHFFQLLLDNGAKTGTTTMTGGLDVDRQETTITSSIG